MCRSRRELSNAYLLAKIGVDTAENEPLEDWGENSIQYSLHSLGLLLAPPVVAQTMVTQGTRDQDKQAVDNEVNADIKAMNEDKDRVEEEEIRLKGKLQGKETDEATKAQERLATAIASIKDSKNTEESVMRTFLYGLSFARDETKKMVETLASQTDAADKRMYEETTNADTQHSESIRMHNVVKL